jgi:CheY-like chemotaxis protein
VEPESMIRIAYVESDQCSQFTFEQITVLLRARGFNNELLTYPDPGEALRLIPLERPDVIFLDIRPHSNRKGFGLDLARTFRQHPLCRNTVIVGMADYAMPADRMAALVAGCHDFVPKPVRYQTVEDIIAQRVLGAAK